MSAKQPSVRQGREDVKLTHKLVSAVNCPIDSGIMCSKRFFWNDLLANPVETFRASAIRTYKCVSLVRFPILAGIVPFRFGLSFTIL